MQPRRCPRPRQDGVAGFCSPQSPHLQGSTSRSLPASPVLTNPSYGPETPWGSPWGVCTSTVGPSLSRSGCRGCGSNRWVKDPSCRWHSPVTGQLFPGPFSLLLAARPAGASRLTPSPVRIPSAPGELHKARLCGYLKPLVSGDCSLFQRRSGLAQAACTVDSR